MSLSRWGLALLTLGSFAVLGGCSGSPGVEGEGAPSPGPARGEGAHASATGPARDSIRFVDIAAKAGLTESQIVGGPQADYIIDSIGAGAAWLDYDGDGDPDLYLVQGATSSSPLKGPPDRLYRNDGDPDGDGIPKFTDVTEAAGLGDRLWGFGAAVADHDADGDPDLYVTNWGADRLYRNNGDGTFTDIAGRVGLGDTGWAASAVWGDPDRDGDLDLYVTRYVVFDYNLYPARGERRAGGAPPCVWRNLEVYCGPRNLQAQADLYYRNEGDLDGDGEPDFRERSAKVGLATEAPWFGLAAAFFDADGDGDEDLYVANDSVQNAFFVNDGTGNFREESLMAGLAYNEQGLEQAGMGVTVGDYDGDGRFDMAVTNFSHDHDTLYRNEGDAFFSDRSYPAGIGTPSFLALAWGIQFADLDHDGWEDLLVARGHVYPQIDAVELGTRFDQRNAVFRNGGNGVFSEITGTTGPGMEAVQSSRAVLPVDLEGDGDLDFLITQWNAAPQLLLREGTPTDSSGWLQVQAENPHSRNRDAIGARVELTAGGRTQIRELRRGASLMGSTLPYVHFGIGGAKTVDIVRVRFTDGKIRERTDVPANQRIVLTHPGK